MPIEITGLVHHNAGSMIAPRKVSEFDLSAIAQSAKVQEDAGFDRVLIANAAIMPDSMSIATFVAASTTRLKLMIAHRPGFIAPTMAARMLATIDQISRGRASVHIIAGASDAELRADGDYLTKEQRYYRCQEYIGILRKIWSSATPVTHEGVHYKFEKAFAEVKPVNGVSIPVFWGGSSDTAVDIGVQSADIYALTGDALAGTREMVQKVRAAGARHGRTPELMMTMVVILGATEAEAWQKADHVLERVVEARAKREAEQAARTAANPGADTTPAAFGGDKPAAVTFQRLLDSAKQGTRLDKCFWTGITQATKAQQGNASTLVGTAEQVADALMDYYDLGITRFLIRGYWPQDDAALFGRELIPQLRDMADRRDRTRLAS